MVWETMWRHSIYHVSYIRHVTATRKNIAIHSNGFVIAGYVCFIEQVFYILPSNIAFCECLMGLYCHAYNGFLLLFWCGSSLLIRRTPKGIPFLHADFGKIYFYLSVNFTFRYALSLNWSESIAAKTCWIQYRI